MFFVYPPSFQLAKNVNYNFIITNYPIFYVLLPSHLHNAILLHYTTFEAVSALFLL